MAFRGLGAGMTAAFRPRDAAFVAAVVSLVALAAFVFDLGSPAKIYFDETWYVPAARAWLATGENLHPEHPPLAKMLIGIGMALFGDDPFGWRAMSALFGAITVVATYLWALALFEDIGIALWTAAITALDQIVYVQARIAMLDIFMFAFATFGLALFTYALKTPSRGRARAAFIAMGLSFGLAAACKFSGWFTLLGLAPLCVIVYAAKARGEGRDFGAPQAFTPLSAALGFVVAPAIGYFAAYLPQAIRHGSLYFLVDSQREMFHIMLGVSPTHPYSSLWYSWPLLLRPVWYLFDVVDGSSKDWSDDNPAAAIVALANPLVVYAGEFALIGALWRGLMRLELTGAIVAVAFFAQWLPWIVNPKGLEFNYYFFPSILTLGPALALLLFRPRRVAGDTLAAVLLAAAAAVFVFFLPALAADFTVTPDDLDARTWLPGWR
ncbi:MAG: phospholipid carrier-dependent glycosyltransferase [Roseiarcus sp.]